jgi:hypothetical protein
MKNLTITFFLICSSVAFAQQREPIIDVHLHCYNRWSPIGRDTAWYPQQFRMPANSDDLMNQSLQALREYNIVKAFVSGLQANIDKWKSADPEHLIEGYELSVVPSPALIEQLRQRTQRDNFPI